MISRKIPHLVEDRDRHGNVRHYVRIKGAKKRRIKAEPESRDFWKLYYQALKEAEEEAGRSSSGQPVDAGTGTVARLIDHYLLSNEFGDLDEGTQARRRRMLMAFRAEQGEEQADALNDAAMVEIMDEWKAAYGPHGANNRLKAVRGLYRWARRRRQVSKDATREIDFFTNESEGFHTWPPSEIRKFMAHWPLGTAPRVAMTVMLCTGVRRGDAYLLGPSNLYRGRTGEERIRFKPAKTGKSSNITVDIPVLPMLTETLAAGPTSDQAFIVGHRGKPFGTAQSFGNSFKRWCVEAGLPHCAAHGLRKGGATLLAESGLTSQQLMAIYGWTKLDMAELYTRRADRRKLGDALSGGFGIEEEPEDDD